ncbi:serine/threonine-protein kinase STY8-like [Salvia splendens]|uniref:serine/threonine-protein kinase STY8-like n=1 Tax=Salvia splendens TaxID=180675 RepID=UPI001C2535C1|nr:serine/threonine-protein kinase STY8-like [Salvia splendens]
MVTVFKLLDWGEEGHRTEAEIQALRSAFTQEVVVWHKLDHPNVTKVNSSMSNSSLRCSNIYQNSIGEVARSMYFDISCNAFACFDVNNTVCVSWLCRLNYLHSQKIVHRDVKTENMLLDKARMVKIADFGVVRVEASNPNDMTGETGTFGSMAPEVLNGNPYNRKCDVYSFGICLWEIYCCDMPYPDLSFSEVTSAVVRQGLEHFLSQCLD